MFKLTDKYIRNNLRAIVVTNTKKISPGVVQRGQAQNQLGIAAKVIFRAIALCHQCHTICIAMAYCHTSHLHCRGTFSYSSSSC